MPRRGRSLHRALNVGALVVIAAILLVFALKLVGVVSCVRLSSAVREAGEAALGNAPTVESIFAAREAMLRVARARGVERPILRAALERRSAPGGTTRHLVLELCARSCHPTVERRLDSPFRPEDVAALARERVGEHTGRRWRRHHD